MANNVFTKIESPLLASNGFAAGLDDMINTINENFRKMALIPVTKGESGDSMVYVRYNPNFLWSAISVIVNNLKTGASDELLSAIERLSAEANADYADWCSKTGRDQNTNSQLDYWKEVASLYSQIVDVIRDYFEDGVEEEKLSFTLGGIDYVFHLAFLSELLVLNDSVFVNDSDIAFNSDFDNLAFKDLFLAHYNNYIPSTITVFGKFDGNLFEKVGTLAYVFIDPRWRNSCVNNYVKLDDNTIADIKKITDHTCVVYGGMDYVTAEDGTSSLEFVYKVNDSFPRLQYTEDGITMIINGQDTGMGATGAAGKDGSNANILPVERMENVVYIGISEGNTSQGIVSTWEIPIGIVTDATTNSWKQPVEATGESIVVDSSSLSASNDGTVDEVIKYPIQTANGYYQRNGSTMEDNGWLSKYKTTAEGEWGIYEDPNISGGCYFRIWGIPGKYIFWKEETDDSGNTYLGPISEDDEGYSEAYNKLAELNGTSCIVMPAADYRIKHYNTIFWLSTIEIIKIRKTDGGNISERYIPVCYCSPDNMINCAMDPHSFAGLMQGLDVYEQRFNADAAQSNKPRGLMVPIGSKWSNDTTNEKSAHIIYSDVANGELEETVNWSAGVMGSTSQYEAVVNKNVLHIGSVVDFSALNDIVNDNGTTNAARPGRKENDSAAFASTELHIDEPVRITMYRDTKTTTKSTLLDVEGDVVVGSAHSNDGSHSTATLNHVTRSTYGGIYINGVLSEANAPSDNGTKFGYVNPDGTTNDRYWGDWKYAYESDYNDTDPAYIYWINADRKAEDKSYRKFRQNIGTPERAALFASNSIYARSANFTESLIVRGGYPNTDEKGNIVGSNTTGVDPYFAVDNHKIFFGTHCVIGHADYYQFNALGSVMNSKRENVGYTHRVGVGMAVNRGYSGSSGTADIDKANPELLPTLGLNFFVRNLHMSDVPESVNPNGWHSQSDLQGAARTYRYKDGVRPVLSSNLWQIDQNDFRGGVDIRGWGFTNYSAGNTNYGISPNKWRYGLAARTGAIISGNILSELPDAFIDGTSVNVNNKNYYLGDSVLTYGDINKINVDASTGVKTNKQNRDVNSANIPQYENDFIHNIDSVLRTKMGTDKNYGFAKDHDSHSLSMVVNGNTFSSGSLWMDGDLQVNGLTYLNGNAFATQIYTTKLWTSDSPSAILMGQGNVTAKTVNSGSNTGLIMGNDSDATNKNHRIVTTESPIILDLGPEYGSKRLIKFSLVDELNDEGDSYTAKYSANPTNGKIFLGQWPVIEETKTETVKVPELLLSGFVGRWGNDQNTAQNKLTSTDYKCDNSMLGDDGWSTVTLKVAQNLMNEPLAVYNKDDKKDSRGEGRSMTIYRAVMYDYKGQAIIAKPQPVGTGSGNGGVEGYTSSSGEFTVARGIMGFDVQRSLKGCTITSMSVTEAGNGDENTYGLFYTHSDANRKYVNATGANARNDNLGYATGAYHEDSEHKGGSIEPGINHLMMNWYTSTISGTDTTNNWKRIKDHICLAFTRVTKTNETNTSTDTTFSGCPGFWFQVYGIRADNT